MEYSAVRQPIYNARKNKVAFQISFWNSEKPALQTIPITIFDDQSDPRKLNELINRSGLNQYAESKTLIISFQRVALQRLFNYFFSSHGLVIEVNESERLDDELLVLLKAGHKLGYSIIINDKALLPGNERFLKFCSHVKVSAKSQDMATIEQLTLKAKSHNLRVIIEHITSDEEFEYYRNCKADFYKGDIFSKQNVVETRSNKLHEGALLTLFQHVMAEDYCYAELTDILAADAKLTHKLLHFLNSVMHGRKGNIYSIKQAVCFMGENKMRKFVSLLTTQELTVTRPEDIYQQSVSRARFCELIAINSGCNRSIADKAFLTGLFSNLPEMLGLDMEEAIDTMKIHRDIKLALQGKESNLKHYMDMVIAYEKADWQVLERLVEKGRLSAGLLPRLYRQMLQEVRTETFIVS
ncbi:EAL and HDOD domain-containing protein [Photobacterium minamisatsumaniensis]|uniref:EAL and HDOD domain-containing protein n=1 Tax=Photobacterium minamisatsumaniensis TaxID=2910233 RepID=UPI003D10E17B